MSNLSDLVNLIDNCNTQPIVKVPTKRETTKKDKNWITLVVSPDMTKSFTVFCGKCRIETPWHIAGRTGWKFNTKDMRYFCNKCL
jgi:hypothetical protein